MSTTSLSSLYNNASSSQLASSSSLSASDLQNEFMDMLMTELKNEDPTNPVDSTTMIAQEAQFESLSQMQDLNTNLTSMLAMQSVTQSLGLIGYTVTGSDTSGSTVTGQVTGINFVNGSAVLALSVTSNGTTTSDTMNLSSVTAVANK